MTTAQMNSNSATLGGLLAVVAVVAALVLMAAAGGIFAWFATH